MAEGQGPLSCALLHRAEGLCSPPLCSLAQARERIRHACAPLHRPEGQVPFPCAPHHRAKRLGSPPPCSTARGRDCVPLPCAPWLMTGGTGSRPLWTTAEGGGTAPPVHHSTGRRQRFPTPHHISSVRRDAWERCQGTRTPQLWPLCISRDGREGGLGKARPGCSCSA